MEVLTHTWPRGPLLQVLMIRVTKLANTFVVEMSSSLHCPAIALIGCGSRIIYPIHTKAVGLYNISINDITRISTFVLISSSQVCNTRVSQRVEHWKCVSGRSLLRRCRLSSGVSAWSVALVCCHVLYILPP